jgi:MoxR-like ATPase
VLVFITSNNERSLPAAFLRRCVIHSLDQPSEALLVKIAEAHFPEYAKVKVNHDMFEAVAKKVRSTSETGPQGMARSCRSC